MNKRLRKKLNKKYRCQFIAGQTGYSDQNYFSRQFKNKFGISPTDFRNTNNQ